MPVSKALEVWTAQTLCDVGILLALLSFLLHIGRPYFERVLGRFTLRVAADLWWLVYIMLRDGTLLFALLFGFLNLNLDLMADIKIGLPFVPLGAVALAMALVTKVFRNAESMNRAFLLTTTWVGLGAVLQAIGYVLIMEAPGSEHPAADSWFWRLMKSWRSDENPGLATVTFYLSMLMLAAIGVMATWKAIRLYGAAVRDEARRAQA